MKSLRSTLLTLTLIAGSSAGFACSILYYYDEESGAAFVANNEDFWMDQKVDILIAPSKGDEYARLWYGWDDFAQGGVNEHGLFFDGAVTPEEKIPAGYGSPRGNLGGRILSSCRTVEDVLSLLEAEKVALMNAHMMVGDRSGNAVAIEWIDGERQLTWAVDRKLVMTNFLLAGSQQAADACPRYQSIEKRIDAFRAEGEAANLLRIGNFVGAAVQLPRPDGSGKTIGTLYSTFIDLKKMELVYVPRLDSSKARKFDLNEVFSKKRGRKIKIR